MSRSKVLLSGSVFALSMGIAGFANAQDGCTMGGNVPFHCNGAVKIVENIEVNTTGPIANVQSGAHYMPQVQSSSNNCVMNPLAPCSNAWVEMGGNSTMNGAYYQMNGANGAMYSSTQDAQVYASSEANVETQYSSAQYSYNGGEAYSAPNANIVISEVNSANYSNGANYSFGNESAVQYYTGGQMENSLTAPQQYLGVGPVPAKVPQVPVNYYGGVAQQIPQNVPYSQNSGYAPYPMNNGPQYTSSSNTSGQYSYSNGVIPNAPMGYYPSNNPNYAMMIGRTGIMPGALPQSFFYGGIANGVGYPTQIGYLGGGSAYYSGGSRFSGVVGRSPTPLIPPHGKPNPPPPPPPTN